VNKAIWKICLQTTSASIFDFKNDLVSISISTSDSSYPLLLMSYRLWIYSALSLVKQITHCLLSQTHLWVASEAPAFALSTYQPKVLTSRRADTTSQPILQGIDGQSSSFAFSAGETIIKMEIASGEISLQFIFSWRRWGDSSRDG